VRQQLDKILCRKPFESCNRDIAGPQQISRYVTESALKVRQGHTPVELRRAADRWHSQAGL